MKPKFTTLGQYCISYKQCDAHTLNSGRLRSLAFSCSPLFMVDMSPGGITGLPKLFYPNQDMTLSSWMPTIAIILELFLNILAASHLWPFIENVQASFVCGIEEGSSDGRMAHGEDSSSVANVSRGKGGTYITSSHIMSRAGNRGRCELPR